jgi:hypothetical protein
MDIILFCFQYFKILDFLDVMLLDFTWYTLQLKSADD